MISPIKHVVRRGLNVLFLCSIMMTTGFRAGAQNPLRGETSGHLMSDALVFLQERAYADAASRLEELVRRSELVSNPSLSVSDLALAAAYSLVRAGDPNKAGIFLKTIDLPRLSPELRELRAWTEALVARAAIAKGGRIDEAVARFKQIASAPDHPFSESALLQQFELLRNTGQWKAVLELLQKRSASLPRGWSRNDWTLELARARLEFGAVDAASALLKPLFIGSPQFERDDEVWALFERIAADKKRDAPSLLSRAQWNARMNAALDAGVPEKAQESFEHLHRRGDSVLSADDLSYTEATLAFKIRDYARARDLFKAYLDRFTRPERVKEAVQRLATSYARSGAVDLAISKNEEIMQRFPQSGTAHWALYKRAFLKMDSGRWSEAEADFDRLVKTGFGPTLDQARWYAGWCAYHAAAYARARAQWGALARADAAFAKKSLYWQAKSFEREGKRVEAMTRYRELANARLDYYGLLSLFKLQGVPASWERLPLAQSAWLTEIPTGIQDGDDPMTNFPALPAQRRLALFAVLGLDEALPASRELALSELSREKKTSSRSPLAVLDILTRGRAYHQAMASVSSVSDKAAHYRYLYPRAWRPWVEKRARDFDVPPSLIYAIMKQESGFQPEIRSPAGAIGLLQIIPPTATRLAQNLSLKAFSLADLKDPYVNILLGSHYLGTLLQQFDGVLPFVIASYNAGEEAVGRWVSTGEFSGDHWEEFVESIPYAETNLYVKKVMVNYWVYSRLYAPR